MSRTKYACFHGTEVPVDFGEAPSQMLEEWCWNPFILKRISRHYSTLSEEYKLAWKRSEAALEDDHSPKQLPDSLVGPLTSARYVNAAHFFLNQIRHCVFDMRVHHPSSREALQAMDISAVHNQIRSEIFPPLGPEAIGAGDHWGNGQVLLAHLMQDDYTLYGSVLPSALSHHLINLHGLFRLNNLFSCAQI